MEKELTKKDLKKMIIKYSAILTVNEADLLYQIAKEIKGNIVEIGSYAGGSTIILAKGLQEPYKVYAIDPHCVIRKIVLKDNNNEFMKFTKKSLMDTLRAKTEGKTSYQARKIANVSVRRVDELWKEMNINTLVIIKFIRYC